MVKNKSLENAKKKAIALLDKLEAHEQPKTLDFKQVQEIISRFDNIENLTKHLNTRNDATLRKNMFNLLESTMNEPQIRYTNAQKIKYLKRFKSNESEKEPFFYILITKDRDKTFITHFKSRDLDYLSNEIQNADSVEMPESVSSLYGRVVSGKSAPEKSGDESLRGNYTTKTSKFKPKKPKTKSKDFDIV